MNIIFIVSDTLRRDFLGCYGNKWVRTPNLDQFASKAIIFDKFYAGSFPTIPMRADLWTGHYVFHSTGWAPLSPHEITFPKLLSQRDYVTMMITDTYVFFSPGMNFHQGFHGWHLIRGQQGDSYITDPIPVKFPCAPEKMRDPYELVVKHLRNTAYRRYEKEYFVAQVMQAAIDWLERNYTHERFMLYVDAFDVHEPWDPPKWYVDLYDPGYEGEEVILPRYDICDYLTDAELRHIRALYAGEITMMDKWVGLLLQKIEDLGLLEDTAVFFTTDHGFYHGEHGYIGKHTVLKPLEGWPLYEEINHVPFIAWIPEFPKGKRSNLLFQPVDVMPTLLELADIPVPRGLNGRSILPALRGEEERCREIAVSSPTLSENPHQRVYSTVTDGEWTLIYAGGLARPELYHLPSDPNQAKNVFDENKDIAKTLLERYIKLLRDLGTSEDRIALRKPDRSDW